MNPACRPNELFCKLIDLKNSPIGGAPMTFSKINLGICPAALAGLLLMSGMQAGLAQAPSAKTAAIDRVAAKDFAGTWNWMFQDRRFGTMTLELRGDELNGSMTNITHAASSAGTTPVVGSLRNGVLRVVAKSGDDETEFAMTLISPLAAELRFSREGAPAHAEAIRLEKVWSEPPVDQ
jgi:hypothetical protein